MSFDINTIINSAIMQAVEAHLTGIQQIYANKMGEMATKIAALEEENMRQRMNHDKLVERVRAINIERKAAEASTEIKLSGLTDVATGLDYNQKDALVNAFIEKLNNQEWFWNNINSYVTETIQRYYSETPTTDEVKDIAKSVVHELWSDVYETEVQDIAERAIDDYDFDDRITGAVRDYDFSDAVEAVLEDYDLSERIEDVITDYDFGDKLEGAFKERLEEVLNNATISIRI